MAKLFANSGDPDQMLHYAVSDLGLHCLPITRLGVFRLQSAGSRIETCLNFKTSMIRRVPIFRKLQYRIYPKYSVTSTPYHICSKIGTSTIHYPMLCLKIAG